MIGKIEPALSVEEWAEIPHAHRVTFYACATSDGLTFGDGTVAPNVGIHIERDDLPAVVALANAALPADDPRKITHAALATLRLAIDHLPRAEDDDAAEHTRAVAFLDGLASYLPPETVADSANS